METCPDAPHAVFTQALAKWLLELRWYPTTGAGMFEDTSWLELMCVLFVLSTGSSIPDLVEGKYVIKGETANFSLVEPTVVQLKKTVRHFISYIEEMLNGNIVPHVKLKTCASAARLCWPQRLAGMTADPCMTL